MGADRDFHLTFLTVMVLTTEVKGPVLGVLFISKYVHPNFTFWNWGNEPWVCGTSGAAVSWIWVRTH